jgi:hypothetical protein
MRNFVVLSMTLLCLASFRIDKTGPWIENRRDQIILYSRPDHYSRSPSPDSIDIARILKSQSDDYNFINDYLKTSFNAQVKLYLFNQDEAKKRFGTNSGGGANIKSKEIYFAFNKELCNKMGDFLGMHELAHIIASSELNYPATRLMNEGYANAISNGYKIRYSDNGQIVITSLEQWMSDYSKSNNIVTPADMLFKGDKMKSDLFYPQAGYFIRWLVDQYGIKTVNALYSLKPKQILKKIIDLTGKNFSMIEKEYLLHLEGKHSY